MSEYADILASVKALIAEREAIAARAATAAEAVRWQDIATGLEAQILTLTALTAAERVKVTELTAQLDRAKAAIRQLTQPGTPPVIADPPKPPVVDPPAGGEDGSSIIRAHDYLERTAEENLTIPRFDWLRANRAPRSTRVGTNIYKANEVAVIADIEQKALWASCIGLSSDYPSHRQGPLTIRNVGHSMQPGATQPTKWGERLWSCSDVTWEDCDYTDIPEEHGNYVNPSGSTSIVRSTFSGLGGHSQYICLRNQPSPKGGMVLDKGDQSTWQYPPNNAVPTAPTTHIIEDCHTRNGNQRAAKGSNTIELFNLGTLAHQATVIIRDCTDVNAFPFQLHTGVGTHIPVGDQGTTSHVRSYAAIVAKTYQDQKPDDVTGPHRHPVALLRAENCLWDYTQSNKQLMSLNDCQRIEFDSCTFIARNCKQPQVKVDDQIDQGHAPTDEVVLANCVSDGVILHWTLPDGQVRTHTLDTLGRFIRLRAGLVVENIPYDPTHRVTQMESASA